MAIKNVKPPIGEANKFIGPKDQFPEFGDMVIGKEYLETTDGEIVDTKEDYTLEGKIAFEQPIDIPNGTEAQHSVNKEQLDTKQDKSPEDGKSYLLKDGDLVEYTPVDIGGYKDVLLDVEVGFKFQVGKDYFLINTNDTTPYLGLQLLIDDEEESGAPYVIVNGYELLKFYISSGMAYALFPTNREITTESVNIHEQRWQTLWGPITTEKVELMVTYIGSIKVFERVYL